MSPVDLAAALVLLLGGVYAVLGGADFGGGLWDLFAVGERRNAQRAAVARTMGPIWETRQFWLLVLVLLLSGAFPAALVAIGEAFLVPLSVAAVALTARGAAYVLRAPSPHAIGRNSRGGALRAGAVLNVAAVAGPIAMGTVLGGMLTGSAFAPVSIAAGLLAGAVCGVGSATVLAAATDGPLRSDFRIRALIVLAVAAMALALLAVALRGAEPALWSAMRNAGPATALAAVALALAGTAVGLIGRWFAAARVSAAALATALVALWGTLLYPYAIRPEMSLADAAVSESTLRALLVVVPIGCLSVAFSMHRLMRGFRRAYPRRPAG
jgi:cytochrome bd ubiquinol oxidase subunit II